MALAKALTAGGDALASAVGLARSLLVYYCVPGSRRAIRRVYGGLVAPGDLVFDIGAHVGSRSRALRALGARVVAVEPQPVFAAFLKRTLPADITLVAEAVGREEGRATLRISRRHPTVSTLSAGFVEAAGRSEGFEHVAWDREESVSVTTLERLIERFGEPAFCKLDVEGLEAEILAGLFRPLRLVAFECVPAARSVALACVDRLETLGAYEYALVIGERGRLEAERWQSPDVMRQTLRALPEDGGSGDVYARLLG